MVLLFIFDIWYAQLSPLYSTFKIPNSVNTPSFFRSTGEIPDGQTDDFIFLSDVIIPKIASNDVTDDQGDVPMDPHIFAANVFWRPRLSFCGFTVGGTTVSFDSLWPKAEQLTLLFMESLTVTSLRKAVGQLALFSLRCGPLRLLRTILELGLIGMHKLKCTYVVVMFMYLLVFIAQ